VGGDEGWVVLSNVSDGLNGSLNVVLRVYDNGSVGDPSTGVYWDDVRLRKYVYPVPLVKAGGEEAVLGGGGA
jgi:hypothetical protein